jgi:hypothetical protein
MTPPASATSSGIISVGGKRIGRPALVGLATVLYLYALSAALGHQAGLLAVVSLCGATLLMGLVIRGRGAAHNGHDRRLPVFDLNLRDGAVVAVIVVAFIALNMHDIRYWFYAWIGDEWPFYSYAESIVRGAPADLFNQAGVYGNFPQIDSAYQALVRMAPIPAISII